MFCKSIYKGLKIITAVLLIIATVYSTYIMADIIISAQTNGLAGLGIIAWFAVAIIAFGIPLLFALIGLISSIIKKSRAECTTGTLIYFIVFTLLPFAIFFGSILIFNIIF